MSQNFYDILWVAKNSSTEDIKKAYRKKAMQYHPDRNKWNKEAENKFKEINTAYETLSDSWKRKNYDVFGNATNSTWNPFSWWSRGNTSYNYSSWWIDLEDLFGNFSSQWRTQSWWTAGFDFSEIFWSWSSRKTTHREEPKKQESLDIEKIYEVPLFDLLLWCKIEVSSIIWEKAKLKIPPNTKPGTKFRVKDFWKNIQWKKWNLIVTIDVRMPKYISDIDIKLLENIRNNIWY